MISVYYIVPRPISIAHILNLFAILQPHIPDKFGLWTCLCYIISVYYSPYRYYIYVYYTIAPNPLQVWLMEMCLIYNICLLWLISICCICLLYTIAPDPLQIWVMDMVAPGPQNRSWWPRQRRWRLPGWLAERPWEVPLAQALIRPHGTGKGRGKSCVMRAYVTIQFDLWASSGKIMSIYITMQ